MSTFYGRKRERIIKGVEMFDIHINRVESQIESLEDDIKRLKRVIRDDINKREKLLTPLYNVTKKWDNE